MLKLLGRIGSGAGTAGTVLTTNWALAMSTFIGIAAGSWAWATQWGYLPVAVFTLVTFGACVWTLNGIIWFRTRNKPSKSKMIFDYSHGLALLGVSLGIDEGKKNEAFQVGLMLHNAADGPIKFHVEDFDVIVGDRTITHPNFKNRNGIVPRGSTLTFFFPAFDKKTLDAVKPRAEGKIKYRILYGHPDDDFIRVTRKRLDASFRLDDKPGCVYLIEFESDEEVKK